MVPDEPGIRYIWTGVSRCIGDKRNLAAEASHGEIIFHWDDDDYSAPHRLERQVERLAGADVTGYNAMLFTDGTRWWKYTGGMSYALGTSLCYRRRWWEKNKFPAVPIGEDAAFAARAAAHNQLVTLDAGDEMYATIHPQNTCTRDVRANQWREVEAQFGLF